jgi:hypothetical protein
MTIVTEAERLLETAAPQLRGVRWAVLALAALLIVLAIGVGFWWFFLRPAEMAVKVDQAKTDATLGRAAGDIATGAIPQINDAARQKVEVDVQLQKGQIDVRSAPDAGVAVGGVAAALRRNLCLYDDLYRADPGCQPLHEDPAGVGPAGSDTGGATGADRR